jgi:putative transposase
VTRECHAGILWEPGGEIPPGHPTSGVVCAGEPVKFAFIAEMAEGNERRPRAGRFPVTFMCGMLGVTPGGYYAWKKRAQPQRQLEDEELTGLIVEIHVENEGRYGVDRIRRELARRGFRVGPQRVRRLARARGLRCVHPEPYVVTTVQDRADSQGLADLTGREFVPVAVDNLRYGDITYVFTLSGWVYLASVIDGCSRKAAGWAVADHMREDLVMDALKMAIARRRPGEGEVIFHSDRGSQYTGQAFRELCFSNGIIPPAGHAGICFDNAAAESWNATFRKELIHLHIWNGVEQVRKSAFEFIEVYYNRKRIQRSLGYLSPSEYEARVDKVIPEAA